MLSSMGIFSVDFVSAKYIKNLYFNDGTIFIQKKKKLN